MKIRGRKIFGFVFTEIVIIGMFFAILFSVPELLENIGKFIFGCVMVNFLILVLGNATIKFIISKWFNKEMQEKEN